MTIFASTPVNSGEDQMLGRVDLSLAGLVVVPMDAEQVQWMRLVGLDGCQGGFDLIRDL
jgi:hypothetical protein